MPGPKPAAKRSRYLELILAFPLKPIDDDAGLNRAVGVLDSLLDRPKLTRDERDYLDVLGTLIERYEDDHVTIPAASDDQVLTLLLEAKQVTQSAAAAATGIPNSVLSNVLHGKRRLNRGQIAKLARYFRVEPTVFDFTAPASAGRK